MTFKYDGFGRRIQKVSSSATSIYGYGYDNLSNLLSVTHAKGSTTLDGASYTVDSTGSRQSRTPLPGTTATNFTYDAIYELLTAKQGSTTKESYTHDPVGNRLTSLGVSSYTNNSSNELTAKTGVTYTYDSNGNMLTKVDSTGTTHYTWDFENRLTSVQLPGSGGTISFKYDAFGRRVEKVSSSTTSIYIYDGDNLIEETNAAGSAVARYTQTQNIDEPLAMLRGTTTDFYEADGLGSITSLTNSSGANAATYTYDSFGNLTASTGSLTNSFRYTGREFDTESNLYYMRARYFDPATGRFLSEDPTGFAGGQANLYAYVGNDPIDFTDPFGLRPLTVCEKRKLAPYIPMIDLDKANLHDGEVPWYLGKDYSGITRGNDIYFRPGVYDPSTIDGLAVLGHELVHVGQYRNGLTWLKYLLASRHGYDKNPYEKPAYDKQHEIKEDMTDKKCSGCSKP